LRVAGSLEAKLDPAIHRPGRTIDARVEQEVLFATAIAMFRY